MCPKQACLPPDYFVSRCCAFSWNSRHSLSIVSSVHGPSTIKITTESISNYSCRYHSCLFIIAQYIMIGTPLHLYVHISNVQSMWPHKRVRAMDVGLELNKVKLTLIETELGRFKISFVYICAEICWKRIETATDMSHLGPICSN